ncbi:type II toxin-antitoxin system ParD family antitoxin [Paraburkholderia strydomiana]|uniref:type II toxin-antitoxin system ParD family antitoxin n=1 Tax=Paraburkholderia strydomiana TaxID=1245417 RepID=UPI0038B823E2
MPSNYPLSISITEHLAAFIRQEVDSGRYGNASEVVRAGLRLLEEQRLRSMPPGSNVGAMSDSAKPPAKRIAKVRDKGRP